MIDDSPQAEAVTGLPAARTRPWWRDELPYLVMLLLAVAGVAYTSIAPHASALFWMLMAVAFAAVCIVAGWKHARGKQGHWRLVWTQALHWGALLLCMQVLFLPDVQGMMNDDATALALIALMALGSFLAGVHAMSWRICVAALLMAAAVPAIAFIEQAAVLLLPLDLLVVAAIIAFLWWRHRRAA